MLNSQPFGGFTAPVRGPMRDGIAAASFWGRRSSKGKKCIILRHAVLGKKPQYQPAPKDTANSPTPARQHINKKEGQGARPNNH